MINFFRWLFGIRNVYGYQWKLHPSATPDTLHYVVWIPDASIPPHSILTDQRLDGCCYKELIETPNPNYYEVVAHTKLPREI